MKLNAAGLELIKRWEGLRLAAYVCPAGVLTVGYGHTRDPFTGKLDVKKGQKITEHQADELLKLDLEIAYEPQVKRCLTRDLTENQFSALVSFVYNLGEASLARSTLLRKVNAGEFDAAAEQFMKWTYAAGKVLPGLVKRRADERALFLR